MKIALTGGTGFIGGRLVRLLRDRGHEVVCLVRSPGKAGALAALGATLVQGDILDTDSLRRGCAGAEGVFHLAASYEVGLYGRRAAEQMRQNLEGTRNVLEAARDAGAQRIIYTSSCVVYGTTGGRLAVEGDRPTRLAFPRPHATHYSLSKARAHYEVALPLMESGAPIIVVQPGAVLGIGDQSVYRTMWRYAAAGVPVPVGGFRIGFVDVEDTAMGHVLALEKGRIGECYHLATENLSLAEILARVQATTGLRVRVLELPDWLLTINGAISSVIERIVPLPAAFGSETLLGMRSDVTMTMDATKARTELGWTPRPLDDTLREVLIDELRLRGKPLPPMLTTSREADASTAASRSRDHA